MKPASPASGTGWRRRRRREGNYAIVNVLRGARVHEHDRLFETRLSPEVHMGRPLLFLQRDLMMSDTIKVDPYDLREKLDPFHNRAVSVSIRKDGKGRFLNIYADDIIAKVYEDDR